MAYSYIDYIANGSSDTYSVPFSYIDKNDVEVYLNGVSTSLYTWTNDYTIKFNSIPLNGTVIKIQRQTNIDNRLVDYQDGSTLTEEILDLDSKQTFYLVQESKDVYDNNLGVGVDLNFDAKNKRITNVANPLNNQDVVTLDYFSNNYIKDNLVTYNKELFTAINSQTTFNLENSYAVNSNTLEVYVNGVKLNQNQYTELDSNTVVLTNPLVGGDKVEFVFVLKQINIDSNLIRFNEHVTLKEKVSEIVSVKDFGAVCDGVTNDTVAVKNAINEISTRGSGVLLFDNNKTTGKIIPHDIQPTYFLNDSCSVMALLDGTDTAPNSFNNDPVLVVKKITNADGLYNVDHCVGGILSTVKMLGTNVAGSKDTNMTWCSILGNAVIAGKNKGTETSPDYDAFGNAIGVAGFARSDKPNDGITTALWGYASTPIMSDTEFDSWNNVFVTCALELNLDVSHKDAGEKSIVSGKGTTIMQYLMNYQEDTIQRNLSFGIAFNSVPRTGYLNTDPNINNWHTFRTGILIDKILDSGIRFGRYFGNNSYGIEFPTNWLTQRPKAAIFLGDNVVNMGEYYGSTFNNGDFWHNDGKLYFKSKGFNGKLLISNNNNININHVTQNFVVDEGNVQFAIGYVANSVNCLKTFGAAVNKVPALAAEGFDTNIDIELRPRGTGKVWIGAWTSNADAQINGYITVKDSDGVVRKIATIA